MKKIVLFMFLIFSLVSCQTAENDEQKIEKSDFLLEVVDYSELENRYFIEKSSKIEPSTSVDVLSEASGRVEKIMVKEWENVVSGQILAYLFDNSYNINTNYKQALLNLEQAKIQYENNKLSLDKAVLDSEMNLEKLKANFENTKKSLDQDLLQAKNNLENTDITNLDWKTALDIQKIDNSIEKMEFEFNTTLKSNQDRINTFILNLNQEKNNLKNFYVNIINFWDSLFSVKYDKSKPGFYIYLWALSINDKLAAESALVDLINFEKKFDELELKEEKQILEFIDKIDESYVNLKKFLDLWLVVLNNSLTWNSEFSDSLASSYISQMNWYISNYSGSYSGFISQKSNIISFLNTYKDSEESLKKQIELSKKDREIAVKNFSSNELSSKVNYEKLSLSVSDTILNMELQIKSAEISLENAKQSRDITLRNLQNSIKNSELNLEKAWIEMWKLVIKAPISGQVSRINFSEWQTYQVWTKALTLINSNKRELDIFVNSEDLQKINIWDKVEIEYKNEKFEWEIFSKSNVADETLNYKVKVSLDKEVSLVWGIASVKFSAKSNFPLIPINSVNVFHSEESKKLWEINIFKDWKIEKMEVEFWEVYGKNIEIKTEFLEDLKIILNDVSNFDENKFNLEIKK